MSDDIQAPEDIQDEDIREVVKELQEEENQESEPDKKSEEPEGEEPSQEDSSEDDDTGEDDDTSEPPKSPERESKYVPVGKHNEERHKRQAAEREAKEAKVRVQELESQMQSFADKPTQKGLDDIKDSAKNLADKYGLDTNFVSEFMETVASRNAIPEEVSKELAELKRERESIAQEKGFESEFESVTQEFPDLANRKKELKELAFSEGNTNTSLRRLALEYMHDNTQSLSKKTAERPGKTDRKTAVETIDYESMTDEDLQKLSGEEFDKYLDWRAKSR